MPGSPAMAAGLQQGGVVCSLDGQEIAKSRDLARLVTTSSRIFRFMPGVSGAGARRGRALAPAARDLA